jgi:hypothetical protein
VTGAHLPGADPVRVLEGTIEPTEVAESPPEGDRVLHYFRLLDPGGAGQRDAVGVFVIDAANVIGSRPTGWWRDRPGATRGFLERLRATVDAGRLDPPVTVVLEGRARAGADESDVDGVEVVHAPGEGDDTIAAIAEANFGVVVVTADRRLADRVRAAGAEVVGPSWLLDQLVD